MIRIFLAALLASSPAAPVLAHSDQQETTPADASTVASVEIVAVRFDDPVRVTAVSLTGPDGAMDLERETGTDPVTEFRAQPASDLSAGTYEVEWRGLSADGHPVQGAFDFTVAD